MADQIRIEQLELSAHIGVPDEERAVAQRLTVNLVLEPRRGFDAIRDDLARTVDYFAVCEVVRQLAEEIAAMLLACYPLDAVVVEVRKYILPDTQFVAVRLRREQQK